MRATCPSHLILDLITLTILGQEYRLLSSPLPPTSWRGYLDNLYTPLAYKFPLSI
jgi:hypothetical protein